jgi:VanZ family protein
VLTLPFRLPRRICIFLAWLPAIGLYGLITFLSHQPQLPAPGEVVADWIWFKSAHFLVYGTLTFFVWNAFRVTGLRSERARLTTWYVILLAAVVDETHQLFIPGRTGRVLDVFIDLLAAWSVLQVLSRYNRE